MLYFINLSLIYNINVDFRSIIISFAFIACKYIETTRGTLGT